MTLHTDMRAYYAQRAPSYEAVYARPERQQDLSQIHTRLRTLFAGQQVLEIACGTGYWTIDLAATAQNVLATDINPEVIEQAQQKNLPSDKVRFAIEDAFDAGAVIEAGQSTACFAGFWWSHVGREQQVALLDRLQARLAPEALLVLVDNCYVEGSSTAIARTDAHGNTYQIRMLENGERYEILKNFPTDSTLRKRLGGHLKEIRIERSAHYWILSGRFKPAGRRAPV